MRPTLALAAAFLLALGFSRAQAQDEAGSGLSPEDRALLDALVYREGDITLPGGRATLALTPDFRFLDQADARRVLEQYWGNPADDSVLGMLVPVADGLDSAHSWAVVITYSDDGHVDDADAATIDYEQLLSDMQAGTREHNAALREAGYPTVDLLGWAQPPRYDAANKRLHWAKSLRFEGHAGTTLNYDIRVLGREGHLSLNAVASEADLARVNAGMGEVLAMARFEPGHRYADFDASTDRTAAYGLAALVGGGLAAKSGLLAKLGLLLAKGWKLLILLGAALVAGLRKWRGGDRDGGAVS